MDSDDRVAVEDDGKNDCAAVASRIQALLGAYPCYTTLPCEYCGAVELEDALHCDDCGEPVPIASDGSPIVAATSRLQHQLIPRYRRRAEGLRHF